MSKKSSTFAKDLEKQLIAHKKSAYYKQLKIYNYGNTKNFQNR